ncbi:MAG TPA: MFS transporter [Solirubrobacterales bacterium]|jgi:EmrB/QacA subfamily drug resistance transporter|nr:MFS transporter [Solirubrobacterales bacterium]
MKRWSVLVVLAAAQFLMVLDQAVMNVSISQLVADFDTTVTAIQAVIALYALVMAGLMLTGGKLGDMVGRRRAFAVGLVIYCCGSALTAASWSVPSLAIGWSVLEGIGAALVLPAMVALVAGNFRGQDRALAYGVLGGVAGAGIAVGPILGGWATTELSWRVVFAGEVVVAIGILAGIRLVEEPPRPARPPSLDWVGSVLSAAGLGTLVLGVLEASNWGWLRPRSSPLEPFGFSLTPFVIAAGALILAGFVRWERRREERGEDPLVHLGLLRLARLRSGVAMLVSQNLILMGVFFTVPLFLQIVQGLDALETGVRMLPASAGLFGSALLGSALAKRFSARTLVRVGLAITFVSTLLLLDTVDATLDDAAFLVAMGVLGVGMGLIVSQLGNVVQSSVGDEDRSEAGGLQNTAAQLGSALGTALLGAIVISGLLFAFTNNVASNERIDAGTRQQVEVHVAAGASFVEAAQVEATAREAGVPAPTVTAIVGDYEDAQIVALKTAFLCAALLVLASFLATRGLPAQRFDEMEAADEPAPRGAEPAPL